ncbi:MAG: hypothetical protein IID30_07720, partial [Planctomycetes bacterium]|nr:hypothetical protein [Planctomycetota bacterium]
MKNPPFECRSGGEGWYSLGAVGGEAATAALVHQLDSPDENSVAAALEALASAGGPVAEQALRARLGLDEPFQRMASLDALNRLGAEIEWDVLRYLLDEPSLRGVLIPALGRSGDSRAVDYLVDSMRRVSPRRRQAVCQALLQLCEADPNACELLQRDARTLGDELCESLLETIGESDVTQYAGAVLVLCYAQVGSSSSSAQMRAQLVHGSTVFTDSLLFIEPAGTAAAATPAMHSYGYMTVWRNATGSEDLLFQIKSEDGVSLAFADSIVIIIIRLDADLVEDTGGG